MTISWTNWAGNQTCSPARFASPISTDGVSKAVVDAATTGRHVRVAGAGHSFTEAVLTDGTLLSLNSMDKILETDAQAGLVRAQGGASINHLSTALHDYGLAFPNLGDIDVQSISGATATGTHGTGASLMNISAALSSIELVTADGSTIEVNADNDPDAWRAARVSIGALGVVSAVTLRMVPSFTLEAVEKRIPLVDVLADLDSFVDSNDHFEFFIFPHTDIALTKRNNRTQLPESPRPAIVEWIDTTLLQNYALEAVCRLGRLYPRAIPTINRTATRIVGDSRKVDRSYRVFSTPRMVRMEEMEYAIPREHAVDAIREIKKLSDRSDFDTPFPIEVRWVAGDDAFLSPAGGRSTCYIAIHMFQGMPWEPYFRAAEKIFDSYNGRPHWGKRHFQTADTLSERYPDWERFAAVRDRLDPDRVFTNDYVQRVLG